jgi:hypothetical protein
LRGATASRGRSAWSIDADVAALELARDAGLLRALQQALVELLAALHVALEHAVLDPLRFIDSASPFCWRARRQAVSCARAA